MNICKVFNFYATKILGIFSNLDIPGTYNMSKTKNRSEFSFVSLKKRVYIAPVLYGDPQEIEHPIVGNVRQIIVLMVIFSKFSEK